MVPGRSSPSEIACISTSRFKIGDKVTPCLLNTYYGGGVGPPHEARNTAYGGTTDGVFGEHGIFDQETLWS